jgi:hypothetical protein
MRWLVDLPKDVELPIDALPFTQPKPN